MFLAKYFCRYESAYESISRWSISRWVNYYLLKYCYTAMHAVFNI